MTTMTFAKIENFRIEKSLHGAPAAMWEFEDRRYHLWIYKDGTETSEIHSNPRDLNAPHDHRTLDPKAKRWASFMTDVWAEIAPEALAKAHQVAVDREAAEDQARLDNEAKRYRDALNAEADRLLIDKQDDAAGNLRLAIDDLDDDQIRRLGRAICSA